MDSSSEDLLTLRLTPAYLRRSGKAAGFEAAARWLPAHTSRHFIRSKDQLEVRFEGGPTSILAVTDVGTLLKCSCGREELRCGHPIAGGLAWLERELGPGGPWGLWQPGDVGKELKKLDGIELKYGVCAGEKQSHALARAARKRLMRNARLAPSGVDLGLFRLVLEAMCGQEEVDSVPPDVFFCGIDDAFDEVRLLMEDGDVGAALEMLEYTMECFRDLLRLLPAHRSKVVECLANVLRAHHLLCRRGPVPPIRAARWLALAYPIQAPALPDELLKRYESCLGPAGIEEAVRCYRVTRTDLDKLRAAGIDVRPLEM